MNLVSNGFSPIWQSPEVWKVTAKRKSTCRHCGHPVVKGEAAYRYFGSFGDGGYYNSWKAVEATCCTDCAAKENIK